MFRFFKYFVKLWLFVIIAPILLWAAGFGAFTTAVFWMKPPDNSLTADAAIVLTGGTNRLNAGLDILAQKRTSDLLISGVHKDVETQDLMKLWGKTKDAPPCCITLGHEADNTIGNAQEAKKWITHIQAKTIFLITSNYHMPRSLVEFHHLLPDVKIIPFPVKPDGFDTNEEKMWRIQLIEYHKLLMTLFRTTLFPKETTPIPKAMMK